MNGCFQAYEVALELAAALTPVLTSLARRDSSLASQLRRAAASVPLCLAEGARRSGKDRLHLLPDRRRQCRGSAGRVVAGASLGLDRFYAVGCRRGAVGSRPGHAVAVDAPAGERRSARQEFDSSVKKCSIEDV
jgi:hypothetical protein